MVGLLLQRGAEINSRTRSGTTPLHTAVLYGHVDVAEYLVEKGADINAKDKYGETPMTIALGDPEGLVYRQLGGGRYDYSFRQPKEQKNIAELLLKLGAAPFTGKKRDRSGE